MAIRFHAPSFKGRFNRFVNDGLSIHRVAPEQRPPLRRLLREKSRPVQEAIEAEFFRTHDRDATLADLWAWLKDHWDVVLRILLALLPLILDDATPAKETD